ncbi:MAG: hypothetical protein SVV80_09300 [Planctomycetota bacterium]|nr:hypothetical protein [Planctomycetota bacterium]
MGVEIETNSAEDIRVLDFNVFIVPGEPIVESPEEEAEPEVFEWPKDSQAWDEIVISSAT